jgi:hypothetical protein
VRRDRAEVAIVNKLLVREWLITVISDDREETKDGEAGL